MPVHEGFVPSIVNYVKKIAVLPDFFSKKHLTFVGFYSYNILMKNVAFTSPASPLTVIPSGAQSAQSRDLWTMHMGKIPPLRLVSQGFSRDDVRKTAKFQKNVGHGPLISAVINDLGKNVGPHCGPTLYPEGYKNDFDFSDIYTYIWSPVHEQDKIMVKK